MSQETQRNEQKSAELFELKFDEPTRRYISEIDKLMNDAMLRAAEPYAQKKQAVMELLTRQHNLTGNWKPLDDGSGMIRVDAVPPQPEFTRKSARPKKSK